MKLFTAIILVEMRKDEHSAFAEEAGTGAYCNMKDTPLQTLAKKIIFESAR